MPPPEPVSSRLVLFPPGTPPERRRRRLLFLALSVAATLAVNWPVYALFSGTFPLVAGMPLSLAWIVLWLLIVFCAQVWLFRHED
jgi:hypothetical protein